MQPSLSNSQMGKNIDPSSSIMEGDEKDGWGDFFDEVKDQKLEMSQIHRKSKSEKEVGVDYNK